MMTPKTAAIGQEVIEGPGDVAMIQQQLLGHALPGAGRSGLWRSRNLDTALVGMDVGDVLGDGLEEVVAASHDAVFVYRYAGARLQALDRFAADDDDCFVWVVTADVNQNGRDEIFVTNVRKVGLSKRKTASFVLEWDGSRLAVLARDLNYYFNVAAMGGGSRSVLGQKSAEDNSFLPEIYELAWGNGALTQVRSLGVTDPVNVYNASLGDIIPGGGNEILMINNYGHLLLMNSRGRALWKSTDNFGSTENYIEMELPGDEIEDELDNEGYRFVPAEMKDPGVKWHYISSPILITDLNQDGRREVIVSHNIPSLAQIGGGRHYRKSEILCLTWGGNGMLENWKTDEIEGVISSFRIGDLDGDGTRELIVCTMQPAKITEFWKGEDSVIMSYPLTSG
jgi:hypothetical protein